MKSNLNRDTGALPHASAPSTRAEAIWPEPRVGAMLPCNVILHEVDGVEVSAIDPVASMTAIDNADPHGVAGQVRDVPAQAASATSRAPTG